MKLNKALLNELFRGFYIDRWNDRNRAMPLTEIDKHSHKMMLAYCLGKYEEIAGRRVDWELIIQDSIFELLRRIAISDIKSPIYQSIKSNEDAFKKLNEFVFNRYDSIIADTQLKAEFKEFLFLDIDRESLLSYRIVDAAHIYSSYWEFQIVKPLNPFLHQNGKIEMELGQRVSKYRDLVGVDKLINNHSISNFVDLCGQLRFQMRWSQTPRVPKTSVLGHTMFVATMAYFLTLDIPHCESRLYNNFFGALFHDLPEAVTRDIISPVKRSSDDIDSLISNIERTLAEQEIFPFIEDKGWIEELKYWTQNEFVNKAKTDKEIKYDLKTEEISVYYNKEEFSPYDGEIVRFCDLFAAYMEASKSIEAGTICEELQALAEKFPNDYKNKKIGGLSVDELLK